MTNLLTVNEKTRTIEMTKAFANNARKFGTPEYHDLQQARRDYPAFKVVTISRKCGKSNYKGLTYEYMRLYIGKHDTNGSLLEEFETLTGNECKGIQMEAMPYAVVKKWFLVKFPEIAKFQKTREELMNGIQKKQETARTEALPGKIA